MALGRDLDDEQRIELPTANWLVPNDLQAVQRLGAAGGGLDAEMAHVG
ncbi:hypothetical protein [Mycobacterium sp.]|nr:hypothetical protein [Mycobacterium sp.]